jgi:hypothetical protein
LHDRLAGRAFDLLFVTRLEISESVPGLVATIDAQRGRPGLQYLDYRGATVPW